MFKTEDYGKSRTVAGTILSRLLDAGRVQEAIGMLTIDGDAAWNMEEREAAKHSYEQAIELARDTSDERLDRITEALARLENEMATPAVKASSLIKEARSLLGKGMKDEALHEALEAVELYRDIGPEDLLANAYHLAATICYEMKQFADAEIHANAAIEILDRLNLDALAAESLFVLGNIQKDQEKTDDALDAYQRAFDIFSRNGNTHAMASCEQMTGVIILERNNRLEALPHFTSAAELYKKNNEAHYAESMYLRAGNILEQLGRYSDALDQFQKALVIIEQLDPTNVSEIATCEERIGNMFYLQHKLDPAMEKLQHAKQVFEGSGNQRMNAAVLKKIGDVLKDKGDVAGATETYYAAIALYETLDDIVDKASIINSLAIMNAERCQFGDALYYYEEAAAIAKETSDMSGYAAYMFNIGEIDVIKGDLDTAEKIIQESLAFAEKNSIVPYLAPFHATYGDLERDRDAFEKATEHYKTSLKYYETLGDPDGIALALCEIARICARNGRVDEATDLLQKGMEKARESGKQGTMAALLSAQGEINVQQGDFTVALPVFEQARATYETAGNSLGAADCLEKMARIHAQLGEIDASSEQMQKARELFHTMGLSNRINRMSTMQQPEPKTSKSEIEQKIETTAGTALHQASKTPAYTVNGKIEVKAPAGSMQPAPSEKKFCMYCGFAYIPGPTVKFCKKCGKKLPGM